MRFGPFEWLRMDDDSQAIVGPDGIVARKSGNSWRVCQKNQGGMSFRNPTITTSADLLHGKQGSYPKAGRLTFETREEDDCGSDECPAADDERARNRHHEMLYVDFGKECSAGLAERCRQILEELGIGSVPLEAAAKFFANQVNVGMAYYHDPGHVFHFEIGLPNDHDGCLALLDAVVAPFRHGRSCGLARTVSLPDLQAVESFFRRVAMAHAAGQLAWEISHRKRREGRDAGHE